MGRLEVGGSSPRTRSGRMKDGRRPKGLVLHGHSKGVRRSSTLYHSMPVERQNSFCSGSDILTHRVPSKLCTPSSMR